MESQLMLNKLDILQSALDARNDAVVMYQINIDNYTLALARIDAMSSAEQQELAEFRDKLTALLQSERLEQKKETLMRDVIEQRLKEAL